MIERVSQATLFALYQLTVMIGIVLLPVAMVLQRTVGRSPPIHRFIDTMEGAYESTNR